MAADFISYADFPEGGSSFLASYLAAEPEIKALYDSIPPPGDLSGVPSEGASEEPLSAATAGLIRELNMSCGAVGESARHLELLTDGETRFVIAGQQPGLLLGPPLALYKLLTIISLARSWSAKCGHPVIPLFWIASHDSDRDEIDHIFLPAANAEPTRFRFPFGDTPARAQVGGMKPDPEEWRIWLEKIGEALPQTGFREAIIDRLIAMSADGPTVTQLFARTVHQLLPGSGIVLFDGRQAEHDPRAVSIMERCARAPGDTVDALRAGVNLLEERSIDPPLPAPPDRLPLFSMNGEIREPVIFEGGKISGGESTGHEPGQIADRVAAGKIRLTPSAALRPVVQDAIFPNAATVVGHSELVYHAQLGPLYRLFGVSRPLLIPRASLFLLHYRTAEKLKKAKLEPLDLLPGESLPTRGGERIGREMTSFLESIDGALDNLLEEVEKETPGAVPGDDPARQRLTREAKKTIDRIGTLVDRAEGNRGNLVHRAGNELFPGGKPQEHVTSPLLFLTRYGWDFAARLLETIEPEKGLPRIAVVDPRGAEK